MVDFFRERTVKWLPEGKVLLIDQRKLPSEFSYLECASPEDVAQAIRSMAVRGAPAIGVAAAMGLALSVFHATEKMSKREMLRKLSVHGRMLKNARPTAVNLAWGVDRILRVAKQTDGQTASDLRERIIAEAQWMADEDVETNRKLSRVGSKLLEDDDVVLTHCKCFLR